MAAVTICSAFGAPPKQSLSLFPSILYEFTPSHTNYTFCLEVMWFWQWGWDVDEHVMVRTLFLHWHLLPDSKENTDQEKRSICSGQRWLAGNIPQWKHPLRLGQPLLSQQRHCVSWCLLHNISFLRAGGNGFLKRSYLKAFLLPAECRVILSKEDAFSLLDNFCLFPHHLSNILHCHSCGFAFLLQQVDQVAAAGVLQS